jgi:hypothetical protein
VKTPSKGGALVAILSRKGPSLSEEDPELPASPADSSFKAVAKAFGIPPERQASAQAALKQYVKSCMGSMDEEETDEGEEY